MKIKEPKEQPKKHYDCLNCPSMCCSAYGYIEATAQDLQRLAQHFGLSVADFEKRYTRKGPQAGQRALRQKADPLAGQCCRFLNTRTRRCTVYEARPEVCRVYPKSARCVLYDVLQHERREQGTHHIYPLIEIRIYDKPLFDMAPPPADVAPADVAGEKEAAKEVTSGI